ncbi:MAG: Glutamyl-tRNA(Gln) amidotransferase subunit A [Parcubacteria group bacterium GW2011_GWC1_45_9]|nr:MAG: Glutamyl-tRNA(Gln) amidotransferase subunit A [Parcubacteria group bacterium GW2011_GWC1_45_9]HCI05569.1 Asp-tRNA(Asn)/Glu-tRNA(Gln) amidotransferase GatCAB subunit A [Patescibacteria group bacterium]
MELEKLTIKKAAKLLQEKQISAVELAKAYLEKLKQKEPELDAFLHVCEKQALAKAEEVDLKRQRREKLGFLAGIPYAVKDNILVQGMQATAGSKILEGYQASYDATVISRLKQADAVIFGKTNLDEFAMGASTEQSAFKTTKNPWDVSRVPGGSSGGSAVAVAANMSLFALGTDTGGSIRQPASFCGIVGLRPSYGAVSRHGIISLASSLDQVGCFAKTVEDAAIVFETIAGKDGFDSTVSPKAFYPGLSEKITKTLDLKKLKIGVPKEFFELGIDPDVKKLIESSIDWFMQAGAKVQEISLPHMKYSVPAYYIILPAEASANLARYDGIRYPLSKRGESDRGFREIYFKTKGRGFGPEPRRRIMIGTFCLSSGYYDAYYSRAQKVRRLIKSDFEKAFEKIDLILGPVSPYPAFRIGEKINDPVAMYLADIYTGLVNMASLNGLSLPCGFVEREGKKLPVGLQIIGKHFNEELVLATGHQFERGHAALA